MSEINKFSDNLKVIFFLIYFQIKKISMLNKMRQKIIKKEQINSKQIWKSKYKIKLVQ